MPTFARTIGIDYSGAEKRAHAEGLLYAKSGAKVTTSTVHTMLRTRLYTGWFEWNGKLIQGKHEALVSTEPWERVQAVMDGRFARKLRQGHRDFAFSGLITCMEEGIQLLELARNAQRLFAKQEPREKRRLLSFLVSNCRWNDGELTATFRQTFDILAEAFATPTPARTPEGVIPAENA